MSGLAAPSPMSDQQGTFLDALVDHLIRAAVFYFGDEVAPTAVLWPDAKGGWTAIMPRLRERLSVIALGPYAPEQQSGPALWIRYAVETTSAERLRVPVVHLPGVGSRQFLHLETRPDCIHFELLAELRHLGVLWTDAEGRDWTLAAFLKELDVGAV